MIRKKDGTELMFTKRKDEQTKTAFNPGGKSDLKMLLTYGEAVPFNMPLTLPFENHAACGIPFHPVSGKLIIQFSVNVTCYEQCKHPSRTYSFRDED